jgi:endonuclease/exonuclease/phosphatase family metal-dependent hydrolase
VRIVSFNVQYARDVPRLAAAIRGAPAIASADVMLVQEIEDRPGEGGSRAERLAAALGLEHVYAPARATGDGGTRGLAVLSRFAARDLEIIRLPNPHPSFPPRIGMSVTLDAAGAPLRVYNVHLDTRINPGERAAQLGPVVEAARRDPHQRVVVGGDFNTLPFGWLSRVVPFPLLAATRLVDRMFTDCGFAAPLARIGRTHRAPVRLDAIYLRGMEPMPGGVARDVLVSDHHPVWIDVRW